MTMYRYVFQRRRSCASTTRIPIVDFRSWTPTNRSLPSSACDTKPRKFVKEDEHVLRIIGQRVGLELERHASLIAKESGGGTWQKTA